MGQNSFADFGSQTYTVIIHNYSTLSRGRGEFFAARSIALRKPSALRSRSRGGIAGDFLPRRASGAEGDAPLFVSPRAPRGGGCLVKLSMNNVWIHIYTDLAARMGKENRPQSADCVATPLAAVTCEFAIFPECVRRQCAQRRYQRQQLPEPAFLHRHRRGKPRFESLRQPDFDRHDAVWDDGTGRQQQRRDAFQHRRQRRRLPQLTLVYRKRRRVRGRAPQGRFDGSLFGFGACGQCKQCHNHPRWNGHLGGDGRELRHQFDLVWHASTGRKQRRWQRLFPHRLGPNNFPSRSSASAARRAA